jgi:nucleoid-associated protein EbfC
MSDPADPASPQDPANPPNPLDLFASAQQAIAAQAQAAQQTVEGSAGGGVVRVEMTGSGELVGVTLAPQVVDPDDVEMLQDLILAAVRDASAQVTELQRQALGAFGQIDLGAIGGMIGELGGPGGMGGPGGLGGPDDQGPPGGQVR